MTATVRDMTNKPATPLGLLVGRQTILAVRRYRFTLVLVSAMLVTSAAYGTFTGHPHDQAMAFGLPALRDGRVWTYVVGALIVPSAALLPLAGGAVAVVIGALEHRVGWWRTAIAVVATHLAGTVGASLLLWAASSTFDWNWADGLARLSDTGLSAGGLGVLGVLSIFFRPPLRRAVRVGVGAYLVVILLRSGLLWDVEHLVSFGAGLLIGPWVAGRRGIPFDRRGSRVSRVRDAAAVLFVATAVTELVEAYFPGYGGPFGSGPVVDPSGPTLAAAVGLLVLAVPMADGLRRGRPLVWHALLAMSATLLALHVVHVVTLSSGDILVAVSELALAVWHHGAARSQPRRSHDVADLPGRITRHGAGSLGWQNTWAGAHSWMTSDGSVALTYRPGHGVAIVVGDPVGPVERWPLVIEEFRDFCEREGVIPAWYAVGAGFVAASAPLGWSALQIGEDTVISLPGLEFTGRSWQDVRTARHRAAKEGIHMEMVHLRDAPRALREQVSDISAAWVEEKPLPEMGFTLGGMVEALDPQVRTHVAVDSDGRVHGVTTWMPVHRDGHTTGWTLDLMRRRSDGFRPVMEFLIAESAMAFKTEGYESLSLSVAPLARRTHVSEGALDRVLDTASHVLEPAYGFRSLLGFKAKFDPAFRPVHLVYASAFDLPLISLAIGRAYLPELTVAQMGHLAGEIGRPVLARLTGHERMARAA